MGSRFCSAGTVTHPQNTATMRTATLHTLHTSSPGSPLCRRDCPIPGTSRQGKPAAFVPREVTRATASIALCSGPTAAPAAHALVERWLPPSGTHSFNVADAHFQIALQNAFPPLYSALASAQENDKGLCLLEPREPGALRRVLGLLRTPRLPFPPGQDCRVSKHCLEGPASRGQCPGEGPPPQGPSQEVWGAGARGPWDPSSPASVVPTGM